MSLQGRVDQKNFPMIASGSGLCKDSEVILKDAARATVLKRGTVMAQIVASKKWVPLTDLTKTDGAAIARGVYIGEDIPAATLVAADVTDCPILIIGFPIIFDSEFLILENALTLDSARAAATVNACRIEDDLFRIGILTVGTYNISLLENS